MSTLWGGPHNLPGQSPKTNIEGRVGGLRANWYEKPVGSSCQPQFCMALPMDTETVTMANYPRLPTVDW